MVMPSTASELQGFPTDLSSATPGFGPDLGGLGAIKKLKPASRTTLHRRLSSLLTCAIYGRKALASCGTGSPSQHGAELGKEYDLS